MIRYRLVCTNAHEFDGWFRSSGDFDSQAESGEIACPQCGTGNVQKALMARAVSKTGGRKSAAGSRNAQEALETKAHMVMRKLRAHVEQNFDYVGDRFAEEARRIHYEETPPREIYGETTLEEARDLVEEGVEVAPLPGPAGAKTN